MVTHVKNLKYVMPWAIFIQAIFLQIYPKGAFNNHVDKERGRGGSQMSTIVHVREGGGIRNVHVDKMFGKCSILAPTSRHKLI